MSNPKMINLSDEGIVILKKLYQEDIDFNFSAWVDSQLINSSSISKNPSKDILEMQLLKQKTDIENHKRLISSCFKEIEITKLKLNEYEQQEKEKILNKERDEQKERDKEEYKRRMIKDMFIEETKRLMTDDEFQEYQEGINLGRFSTLFDYLEYKGLIENKDCK